MEQLIENFSVKIASDFFKTKIAAFQPKSEDFNYILENKYNNFSVLQKIGEIKYDNTDELIVFACKHLGELSEKSSKKTQFEIAKKVLKDDFKDGAIFIFYDDKGCFRFSFIRRNYGNKEQKYSSWKRYTYFVDPKATNKTFKTRLNNCHFTSLDEIQEAFSVEKLNKKFYEEIATSFYSLIGGKASINKKEVSFISCLQLPSKPIEDEKNRADYQEFSVRLIGRTIFCWFLKNKKSDGGLPLIPPDWLSSKTVESVNNDQHNYYHSILEKLFFLVLNKKHEDRKPYLLPTNHEFVPFLNGGLFEAQNDDFFPKDSKGIHSPNFALNIPNQWFKDFFNTLEQYNFTIDENSINDFEVSIDPEMLGTIFENLLAEIDPDTEKSARKSTGSFYTPREIVDYMVEMSLLQYLKTKTNIVESDLEFLLKDESTDLTTFEKLSNLTDKQKEQILEALSDIKILDPACGSGAFPMGVLHKIIGLLKKLDKGAVWWKAKQLEKIDNAIMRKIMDEKLSTATSDYARKLGVIQHSIYGVDIQPIAAEISKLRSFLSLIIDENIDDKAENRGIIPLPNLEFKFVTANTLIGLEAEKQQTSFDFGNNEEILNELQKIRTEYLQAKPSEKDAIKKRFKKVQEKINRTGNSNNLSERQSQLYHWNPFSNEKSTWFDPAWMFGVAKFDIVIGNPPYGVSVKGNYRKDVLKHLDKVPDFEIYYFFIEIAKKYLKVNGVKTYIIPNSFLFNVFASDYRKKLLNNWSLFILDCTAFKIFEKATVLNAITVFTNTDLINEVTYKNTFNSVDFQDLISKEIQKITCEDLIKTNQNWSLAFKLSPEIIKIVSKIKDVNSTVPLVSLFPEISQGLIAYDSYQGQSKEIIKSRAYHYNNFAKNNLKKWLWGGDVTRYSLKWNEQEWIDYCDGIANPRNPKYFVGERILIREITNPRIFAAITNEELYHDPAIITILKSDQFDFNVLLALINSKLFTFYHFNSSPKATKGAFPKILVDDVKNFPIKVYTEQQKAYFLKLSETINDFNFDNSGLDIITDNKIDLMVYKLYDLTYTEVLLVEPDFGLSKEEYYGFEI
jgi:adenine-specific DNA-methyltransferase